MKTVLVVEPDRLMRALVAEWLAAAGLEAVEAGSRGDLDRRGDVDAILVDMKCPRQANDVVRVWRCAYPRAAIIAVSAQFVGTCTANDDLADRLGVTRVLAKPFTRNDLWTALGLPAQAPPRPALSDG